MLYLVLYAYAIGAVGTFVFNGAISCGPIRWRAMFLSALIWPVALPVLINANRGS